MSAVEHVNQARVQPRARSGAACFTVVQQSETLVRTISGRFFEKGQKSQEEVRLVAVEI